MKNLQTILSDFEIVLAECIEKTWSIASPIGQMEAMAQNAYLLSEKIIAVGEEHFHLLQEKNAKPSSELYEHYFINYVWPEAVKSIFILWRNILFQNQKAYFLKLDGYVDGEKIKALFLQSKTVMMNAALDLKNLPEQELSKFKNIKKGKEKSIREWKLEQNPWPLYRDQIQKLAAQCSELMGYFYEMKKVSTKFQEVRKLIERSIASCKEGISDFKTIGEEAIELIKTYTTSEKEINPGKLIAKLEDLEEGLKLTLYGELFSNSLAKIFEDLPSKSQIPIDIDDGIIYLREINFNRAVKQWLESEIMPLLFEIWESTENAQNNLKMSLVNVQNRMVLLSKEVKENAGLEINTAETIQFLNSFFEKTIGAENSLNGLKKTIRIRLDNNFKFSDSYESDEDFLELPLQSTVNRFKLSNIKLFDKGKNWVLNKLSMLRRFQRTVEVEESLSNSEKIVRFVKSRKPDADNLQYSSIFLTKGYIGESFWVGRQKEVDHIKNVINNWKQGFRGAVAITGNRLSGKSLFGFYIANHFFRNRFVTLSPNSVINIDGSRMNTTYNLEEALQFIKKHSDRKSLLIWIDDIELWSHPQFPLSQNIQKLLKYIDNNSRKIFFLVSMSNWLKAYLNRFFEISKAFQAELNMDKMSFENVQEAILIRHGATHKKMMTAEGQELPPNQFRKIIRKTYKLSDGNIGDALNFWAAATKKLNKDEVIHEFLPAYILPDFIDPNTGILLSILMREKKSNEYHLRKLFGPSYNDNYAIILQRLIGLGLILRLPDGKVEINESIANDVVEILKTKKYFQFVNN